MLINHFLKVCNYLSINDLKGAKIIIKTTFIVFKTTFIV